MNETKDGGPFEEILQYDIFVNCIKLMKVESTINWELINYIECSSN